MSRSALINTTSYRIQFVIITGVSTATAATTEYMYQSIIMQKLNKKISDMIQS